MAAAKHLEIGAWLKELVCEKYRGVVPASRLMKMRWVLTFKVLDRNPSKIKAKARLVLLGYSDPDLLELQTSSPTMTRRSRQLLLNLCTHQHWRLRLRARGRPERFHNSGAGAFASSGDSAWRGCSAPRSWYLEVCEVLGKIGLRQLRQGGGGNARNKPSLATGSNYFFGRVKGAATRPGVWRRWEPGERRKELEREPWRVHRERLTSMAGARSKP